MIQEDNSDLKWDGTNYPYDVWNKDHDLYSAVQNSASWYFQDIDKLSGLKNLQKYFKDIGYGNYDLSGGVSNYWAESSLLISPVEQVKVLEVRLPGLSLGFLMFNYTQAPLKSLPLLPGDEFLRVCDTHCASYRTVQVVERWVGLRV